jgi:ADP-ribosylglycohydrolase
MVRRAAGCLFGTALGDALGAPTEFLRVEEIVARWPPAGPTEPTGDPALVTDDTQMMLAVGEALAGIPVAELSAARVEPALRAAFVAWLDSPDNNRAPGMTCLQACEALRDGRPFVDATVINSKGCGANMRVQPVGLLGAPEATRAGLAQLQAALTHGHPTALAAADLTAAAIAWLADGEAPAALVGRLLDYATAQRETYHAAWLGALWQRPGVASPADFIARGWDECVAVLERLRTAVRAGDRASDPCVATGEGWIAEEAFATGLLCFLLFPDDPVAALRRAAVTAGDSDSIACLAGAFSGAHHGVAAWPADWLARIEYRARLTALAEAWDR